MRRALSETIISGVDTTLQFNHLVMYNRRFLRGKYTTAFIDNELDKLLKLLQTTEDLGKRKRKDSKEE